MVLSKLSAASSTQNAGAGVAARPGEQGDEASVARGRAMMLVGAATPDAQGDDFEDRSSAAGPWTVRRSYTRPTSGWPVRTFEESTAGPDLGKRASVWSGKPPIGEVGSGALDEEIRAFLKSIPKDHVAFVTIWHEPDVKLRDGLFSLRQYKKGFQRFCELVREVQQDGWDRLYTYQCVTCWAGQKPKQGSTYEEMWPGEGLVDVYAVDGYSSLGSEDDLWGPALKFARSKRIPWAIGEVGWSSRKTQTTRWLRDQADYAANQSSGGRPRAAFFCFFDVEGPLGGIATPGNHKAGKTTCREIAETFHSNYRHFIL